MKIFTQIVTGIILWLIIIGVSYVMMILGAKWFPGISGMLIFSFIINIGLSILFTRILLGNFKQKNTLKKAFSAILVMGISWGMLLAAAVFNPLTIYSEIPPSPITAEVDSVFLNNDIVVAYTVFEPDSLINPNPIIFLHPGPGAFGIENTHVNKLFENLSKAGIRCINYDQPGSGISGRLSDPSGYTRDLQLDILDQLLTKLGIEKAYLMGESYGAGLAARFAALHPAKVEGLFLISPGPLYNNPWKQEKVNLYTRLPVESKQEVNRMRTKLRILTAYLISQRSAKAAQAFLGDDEADSYFSLLFHKISSGGLCDVKDESYPYGNCGFWSSIWTARNERGDTLALPVSSSPMDVILLRGECEYLPERVLNPYQKAFPALQRTDVKGSGHFMLHEASDIVYEKILESYGLR